MHIVWIVFGILGALWIFWDTRKQNFPLETSIRWAVGTLIVPAAVIPVYLLLSHFRTSHRKKRKKPQDVTSNMRQRCYFCGEFYQGNPDKCPNCERELKKD